MALDNLRAFLGAIEARGDLVRVNRPVSVDREITEIADRCMKAPGGGPALVFARPTLVGGGPSRYAVAVNLFGSAQRMALALGVECLDEIGERIAALLNLKVPDTLLGKLAMLPQLAEIAKFPPKTGGRKPPCQEVVLRGADVDLTQFPVPICWPEDGGPYITLPGVITRDPTTGIRNVGMYRIQVIGRDEVAMHWQRHKVGAAHWRAMAERGATMPVAIALGGDPASIYAASAPLPPSIDEFLFAGFLRREPVRLAPPGVEAGPVSGRYNTPPAVPAEFLTTPPPVPAALRPASSGPDSPPGVCDADDFNRRHHPDRTKPGETPKP